MPWTGSSGRTYRLVLLDTNALSEIVKNPDVEGAGFLSMMSEPIAPCFTPYNLAELYASKDVFDAFIELFRHVPIFMTFPWEMVFDQEIAHYEGGGAVNPLLNAFTPDGPDPSYDLRSTVLTVFEDQETKKIMAKRDYNAAAMHILDTWLRKKDNFEPKRSAPNSEDAERFVKEAGLQTLIGLRADWMKQKLEQGEVPQVHEFPTLSVMLYSQYWRFWDSSWTPGPGEVRDIQIMAVAPYMDVVITEKRQAEIFRKIRKVVPGLEDLQVMRLRDLRRKALDQP